MFFSHILEMFTQVPSRMLKLVSQHVRCEVTTKRLLLGSLTPVVCLLAILWRMDNRLLFLSRSQPGKQEFQTRLSYLTATKSRRDVSLDAALGIQAIQSILTATKPTSLQNALSSSVMDKFCRDLGISSGRKDVMIEFYAATYQTVSLEGKAWFLNALVKYATI